MTAARVARIAVLIASIAAHTAAAQEAPSDAQAEARRLFDEAVPMLEAGRFADARPKLERALELFPNLPTAFNLAVARRRSGATLAAIDLFETILAGRFGSLSSEQRTEAQSQAERARRELSTLRIRPRGARSISIAVDGETVGAVAGGGEIAWKVDAGEHVVRASADGHTESEERVTVRAGQTHPVELTIEPAGGRRGTLEVRSENPGDRVEIEGFGAERGQMRLRLRPGIYTVRVSGEHGVRRQRAEVVAGRELRLDLTTEERDESTDLTIVWIGAGVALAAGITAAIILSIGENREAPVTDPVLPIVDTLRF